MNISVFIRSSVKGGLPFIDWKLWIFMRSSPVVVACRNLFQVKPFLAHGIIPTLRMEDIKIALAKRLHTLSLEVKGHPVSPKSEEFFNSYTTLAEYIREYNLEVILALASYSDSSADNETYLYVQTGVPHSPFAHHRSVIAKKELYFSGSLPPKKMRLSSYLYYKGLISRYHVLESIAWQKDRRPLIGQMAMQIGKLTADEFARIIVHVKNGECFGHAARKLKLLSGDVISTLVKAQEKYDCRIGRYFTEKKLFSEKEIDQLDSDMQLHNCKFTH